MIKPRKRIGAKFSGYYPTGGTSNVLRKVEGIQEKFGTGPNGPYRTIHQSDGKYRTLSEDKIVWRLN